MNFVKKSDTIYLLGDYKKHIKDKSSILEILYDAISQNLVTSAHSLEKSGLFCGLIEACSIKKLGFDITGDAEISDKDFLFKDKNSAILVSVSADKEGPFVDFFFKQEYGWCYNQHGRERHQSCCNSRLCVLDCEK